MFVELIYDKRNVASIPNAEQLIRDELQRRVHRVFPGAEVKVKPMMGNSSINTDGSKHEKGALMTVVQDMFEEADSWLINDI